MQARLQEIQEFKTIRQASENLCLSLEIEDYIIQTANEASPVKWNLAHVTWFYETFILIPYMQNYKVFHPQFAYLFNSYYTQVGEFFPRSQRGLLSRPTVKEVYVYRAYVDEQMQQLLQTANPEHWPEIQRRLAIGLQHEQQHQELLLTDLKYNLALNPLRPAYRTDLPIPASTNYSKLNWLTFAADLYSIGHDGLGFAYDNESPRHQVWLNEFKLANRLITNAEYLDFIADNGYQRAEFWLSDGWTTVQQQAWTAPLYWEQHDNQWYYMTLGGMREIDLQAPVCHVSYYEANAFAAWAGKRLPLEAEWEIAAKNLPLQGNFRDNDFLQPIAANNTSELTQMYGDVWEWTQSPYIAYPGYKAQAGALGEYNGKFMCNQMVLRGGSCITPNGHIRATYRNFFYPHERWQFKGFRLAAD